MNESTGSGETTGRAVVVALAMTLVLAAASAQAGTPASTANDVCASNVNPCNVTTVFDVADNSTLDFGVRSLNINGSGQFNFSNGSGSILCGPFTASTALAAIDAKGPDPGGGTESGSIRIAARRLCTGGNGLVPCTSTSADCQLGACNTRRCTGNTARECTTNVPGDTGCQLGVCGLNKSCTLTKKFFRCSTNADCELGTCPTQLTCKGRAVNPVNCSSNTDCDFGTCTIGTASLSLGGSITGNSDSPASVSLRAADSVTISKAINLSSTHIESDGGDLTVDAGLGSITVSGDISAPGGGNSAGGSIDFNAATDVVISGNIDADGGDFDGGSIDISADRDVTISGDLTVNATSGAGYGGDITLDAGRHLTLIGVSSLNKTTVESSGHTDIENSAGDAGELDISSGADLWLKVNTRLIGTGPVPDAYGSDMYIDAGGTLKLDGAIVANATGADGTGGQVEITSEGTAQVGSTGSFDLTSGDGGDLSIDSGGDLSFAGSSDVSGGAGGQGGTASLSSEAGASLTGTLFVNGGNLGSLEMDACYVNVLAGGALDNNSDSGDNSLIAHETMKLFSGSSMTTNGGPNILQYRNSLKPPVVQGTVSPAAQILLTPELSGCLVCGNSFLDGAETCDDGNTVNGDGCSSACQNENCLAQTAAPGYPGKPICFDNDPCTTDVCNTLLNNGTCQHSPEGCDDQISCTTDSCNTNGDCVHAVNNAACNDGNPCTNDFCAKDTGCDATNNTSPCDDGIECTSNDTCSNGQCHGTAGDGCGVCGDGNVGPNEACDDGNATFANGEYCGVGCVLIPCGKPTNSSGANPKASDALWALKTAVHAVTCHVRVCDVDNSGAVFASDALRILRKAVGQVGIVLNCPTG